jgi:Domain of unknown function (DUF4394)
MICPHFRAAAFAASSLFLASSAIGGQDLLVLDDTNGFFRVEIGDDDELNVSPTVVAITGLGGGETITSIAIDPATGNLIAYSSSEHCYIVDKDTGVAVDLGAITAPQSDAARFVDIEPVSGRLRVQGSDATNIQYDPDSLTVELVGFAPHYGAGDAHDGQTPALAGSAFSNSIPGASSTQAYALDSATDSLAYQSHIDGQLFTIGGLGLDASLDAGLAIDLSGRFVAAVRVEGETASRIYRADTETGALTELGDLGDGVIARDIAFDLDPTSGDLDDDGWPDDIEIAGASNFADPSSSPFPSATKVPALTVAPALAQKLRVKLRFNDPADSSDRIVVKGKLPVAEGSFSPAGKTLIADVGGVVAFFALDSQGRGTSAEGYTIDIDTQVGLGGVKFKLVMDEGAFQASLADEGLIEDEVDGESRQVVVDIWMSNLHARKTFEAVYSATTGGEGFAH